MRGTVWGPRIRIIIIWGPYYSSPIQSNFQMKGIYRHPRVNLHPHKLHVSPLYTRDILGDNVIWRWAFFTGTSRGGDSELSFLVVVSTSITPFLWKAAKGLG